MDFRKLAKALGAKSVKLASEQDLKELFPDVEVGAEPPFGSLYDVPTIVDDHLTTQDEIVFQAGTHKDTVRMKWTDYQNLEKPKVADFGEHI